MFESPRCQGRLMIQVVTGDAETDIPECDEPGCKRVEGFVLCVGCFEAREALHQFIAGPDPLAKRLRKALPFRVLN